MKLSKNKRGDEGASDKSIMQIGGVIIGAMVVLGLIAWVIMPLYNLFLNKPDQGTVFSFNQLADTIESLKDQSKDGAPPILVHLYLGDGFKIVGFSENKNSLKDTCFLNSNILRPGSLCGKYPCLLLCDEKEDGCTESKIKDKRQFGNYFDKILAEDLNYNEGDNKNLILYGSCGLSDHGTQDVYVSRSGRNIIISSLQKTIAQQDQQRTEDVKKLLANILNEKYDNTITFMDAINNLCDSSNGILNNGLSGLFAAGAGKKEYYTPQTGQTCLNGLNFISRFRETINSLRGKVTSLKIDIIKGSETIIAYHDTRAAHLYLISDTQGSFKIELGIYYFGYEGAPYK